MSARFDLEHRLWALLKEKGLTTKKFLLACSGGADSMALVRAFVAVRPKENLIVAHFHHGGSSKFRRQALEFSRQQAEVLGVSFLFKIHEGQELKSEDDFRRERRKFLLEASKETQSDLVVTGHHAEDLLETRLMRLIRGTGPQGLPAILLLRSPFFRPFLQTSRKALREYLAEIAQTWVEDPSNSDSKFLRNWIRTEWLPDLESRQPGAVKALARSLENCATGGVKPKKFAKQQGISRSHWENEGPPAQRGLLAAYLTHLGVVNFTRGQLEEVRKRLDSSRKEHTFVVAGCLWQINAQQIFAKPSENL